jgi:MYXO-CTERM domain-containing protein
VPPADLRRQHTPKEQSDAGPFPPRPSWPRSRPSPVSAAIATTPPSDPDDATQVDKRVDNNDSGGFDDRGLLGLLGLAGLAGPKRRYDRVTTIRDDNVTTR